MNTCLAFKLHNTIFIFVLLQVIKCYSFEPKTVVVSRTRGEWGYVLCNNNSSATPVLVCWDTLVPGHLVAGDGWIPAQGTEGNCSYDTALPCKNQTLIQGMTFESVQDLASPDDINVTYEGMYIRFLYSSQRLLCTHHQCTHSYPPPHPGRTAGA
jgi:hypothetical protein